MSSQCQVAQFLKNSPVPLGSRLHIVCRDALPRGAARDAGQLPLRGARGLGGGSELGISSGFPRMVLNGFWKEDESKHGSPWMMTGIDHDESSEDFDREIYWNFSRIAKSSWMSSTFLK